MQYFFSNFLIKFIFQKGNCILKTISFALDKTAREAFGAAFEQYYNHTLPRRIAVSSLYRAFVIDYTARPWYYIERFKEYDLTFPESNYYYTYTFRVDEPVKERFYTAAAADKPSRILRCFTADFAANPTDYIRRFSAASDVNPDGAPPIMFFGV